MTRRFTFDLRGSRSPRAACALIALLAALFAGADAQAQAWKGVIAEADAKYADAMQKHAARRKAAEMKAGGAWLKGMADEIADVRKTDAATAQGLVAKVAAVRQAGRVPAELPARTAFGGHQYALITPGKTWNEARKHCEQMGGHLLLIDSEAEEAFIVSNLAATDFWVGATALYSPGKYLRLDGAPFKGFKGRVFFNDANKEQKSVAWRPVDKSWDDVEDGMRMAYVCEWE
ncbi:MAG TPA: C-type lectin domain-containing protein [Pirellulaceae bacterium]|jgi:hypothetical protein|nr:C-type lectin domain-containing protein [Pirellulaceae bacterium]